MRITLQNDVQLGSWTGTGDKSGTSGVCVYSSAGENSPYNITATTPGGSFNLVDGVKLIPFTLSFSKNGSSGPYVNLNYGAATYFSNGSSSAETCGGGTNASVRIAVSENALGAAQPGSYSTDITLTLSPGA